jgi:hypothetical protein
MKYRILNHENQTECTIWILSSVWQKTVIKEAKWMHGLNELLSV